MSKNIDLFFIEEIMLSDFMDFIVIVFYFSVIVSV